jgi:lipopolysaccharide/colanic/teichoic acid biosynthesis glycosyltransferase
MFKRITDIIFISIALLLLSPMLLEGAVLILLGRDRPVFGRGNRAARWERTFTPRYKRDEMSHLVNLLKGAISG